MNQLDAAEKTELAEVAHALADAASVETLRHFRAPGLTSSSKSQTDFDPVTIADRAAEEAMRRVLTARRPDDAILGEEIADQAGISGLNWVLDPIDGTRSYISGTPTWGTLIAVGPDSGPVFGIIDQPYIGERFVGGFGEARLIRGRTNGRFRYADTTELSDAILFTTFPEVGTKHEGAAFHRLSAKVRLTRYGLDCYAYALLAWAGRSGGRSGA